MEFLGHTIGFGMQLVMPEFGVFERPSFLNLKNNNEFKKIIGVTIKDRDDRPYTDIRKNRESRRIARFWRYASEVYAISHPV